MAVPGTIVIAAAGNGHIVQHQLGLGIVHGGYVVPVAVLLVEVQRVVVTVDGDTLCVYCTNGESVILTAPCRNVERSIVQQVNHNVLNGRFCSLGCIEGLLKTCITCTVECGNGLNYCRAVVSEGTFFLRIIDFYFGNLNVATLGNNIASCNILTSKVECLRGSICTFC